MRVSASADGVTIENARPVRATPAHPNLKHQERHRFLPEITLPRLGFVESQAQSGEDPTNFLPRRVGYISPFNLTQNPLGSVTK